MDFESLKRKIEDVQFTSEQEAEFREYYRKEKIGGFATLTFICLLIGIVSFCAITEPEPNTTPTTVFGFVSVLCLSIAFYFAYFVPQKADKRIRKTVLYPILSGFLPGSQLKKETISLETCKRGDEYDIYTDSISNAAFKVKGEYKNDCFSFTNNRFHMNLHQIEIGYTIRTENREGESVSEFVPCFEGKFGCFNTQESIHQPLSIHQLSFKKTGEQFKQTQKPTTRVTEDINSFLLTLKSFLSKDRQVYAIPSFLQGTDLEKFICAYTDYFGYFLHIVAKENEIFIYENWKYNEIEKQVKKLPLSVQNDKKEELKIEIFRTLSYVIIAEEIIKMNRGNR